MSNQNVADQLQTKHQQTIQHIKKLQEIEKYMFNNLQNLDTSKSSGLDQQTTIKNRINELKGIRENLFKSLKGLYTDSQKDVADSREDLTDSLTVVKVLEDELNNAKNKLKFLRENKQNKIRLAEIGDWEYERYESHKNIIKNIVYGCLVILLIVFLMNFAWFPSSVGSLGIIITIAWVLISIARTLYWNYLRDDRYYQKFNQGDTSHLNDPENPYTGAGATGLWDKKNVLSNLLNCKNAQALGNEISDVANKVRTGGTTARATVKSGFRNRIVPYETKDTSSLFVL